MSNQAVSPCIHHKENETLLFLNMGGIERQTVNVLVLCFKSSILFLPKRALSLLLRSNKILAGVCFSDRQSEVCVKGKEEPNARIAPAGHAGGAVPVTRPWAQGAVCVTH